MLRQFSIVLVGDVVEMTSPTTQHTLFDCDSPNQEEVVALARWIAEAGHDVAVRNRVLDFVNMRPDSKEAIIFPLWRGGASRNRTTILPAICEARNLPYVGGDAFVQSVCQDKSVSKAYARAAGFIVPGEWVLYSVEDIRSFRPTSRLTPPFVVKPLFSACSIGITQESLCVSDERAIRRAEELFAEAIGPVVCEEFVEGDEVSLCFIEDHGRITDRCVATYRDENDLCPFYDRLFTFDDKISKFPAWDIQVLPELIDENIWHSAESLIRVLGKVDYMRIDGRMHQGRFVMIELTPDVHMALTSSFLGGFAAAGVAPTVLLDRLIKTAIRNQTPVGHVKGCRSLEVL